MRYQIFTNTPAVAVLGEKSFELDNTNALIIETEDACTLNLYPLSRGMLPTALTLSKNMKDGFVLDGIRFVRPEFIPVCTGEVFLVKNFTGGKTMTLSGYPLRVSVSSGGENFSYAVTQKISDFKLESVGGKPALCGKCKSGDYRLFFTNGKFYELYGELAEEGKQIKSVTKLAGVAKHGKFRVFSSQNLSVSEDELVYLKKEPVIPKNLRAKGFAFFEAVQVGDYDLARSYLSESLAKKLSDEHLQKFFGDFTDIIPVSSYTYALRGKDYNLFTICFDGNKIVDVK